MKGPLPRSRQTQRRRRLSRSGWWLRRQLLGRAAARHKSPSSKPPALGEAGEEVVVEPVVEAEEDPLAAFSSGAAPLAATALGTARAPEEEGAWVRSKFANVFLKCLSRDCFLKPSLCDLNSTLRQFCRERWILRPDVSVHVLHLLQELAR